MLIPVRIILGLALAAAVYVFLIEPRESLVWYEALVRFLLLTAMSFLAVLGTLHWGIKQPIKETVRWISRLLGRGVTEEMVRQIFAVRIDFHRNK